MKAKAIGHVFMAMSLDGFVARRDNDISWLMKYDPQGQDHGYDAFIESIDVIVMGSGTFKTVLGFEDWPYTKPIVVLSRSMTSKDIPAKLQSKVEISSEEPEILMQKLFERGLKDVYVDGGLIVQSFLKARLIKDLTITIIPILLGDGKRLFGEIDQDIDLKLLDSKKFKCGFVQNHYKL